MVIQADLRLTVRMRSQAGPVRGAIATAADAHIVDQNVDLSPGRLRLDDQRRTVDIARDVGLIGGRGSAFCGNHGQSLTCALQVRDLGVLADGEHQIHALAFLKMLGEFGPDRFSDELLAK